MAISRGNGFTGVKSSGTATEDLGAPKLALFQVDFKTVVSDDLGGNDLFDRAIHALMDQCTIMKIGPLAGGNTKVTVVIEDIGQTASQLQDALRATNLGGTTGFENDSTETLAAATVTLKDLNDDLS